MCFYTSYLLLSSLIKKGRSVQGKQTDIAEFFLLEICTGADFSWLISQTLTWKRLVAPTHWKSKWKPNISTVEDQLSLHHWSSDGDAKSSRRCWSAAAPRQPWISVGSSWSVKRTQPWQKFQRLVCLFRSHRQRRAPETWTVSYSLEQGYESSHSCMFSINIKS